MGRAQRCWRDLQVSLEMGVWPHPAGLALLRAPLPSAGLSQVLVSPPPGHQVPPNGAPCTAPHTHICSPWCPDQRWQLGDDVDRRTDRQTAAGYQALLQSAFAQQTRALCTPNPPRCSPGGAGSALGFALGEVPGAEQLPLWGGWLSPTGCGAGGRGQGDARGPSGRAGCPMPRAAAGFPGGCISCTGSSPTRPCTPGPAPRAASG